MGGRRGHEGIGVGRRKQKAGGWERRRMRPRSVWMNKGRDGTSVDSLKWPSTDASTSSTSTGPGPTLDIGSGTTAIGFGTFLRCMAFANSSSCPWSVSSRVKREFGSVIGIRGIAGEGEGEGEGEEERKGRGQK